MGSFIGRHLDPADRLSEVLFGLIMALAFTGAVRLGIDEADNASLFKGILGCNVAWGIVDGAMYVLAQLFERGRTGRLLRGLRHEPDERAALQRIGDELDERIAPLTTADERQRFYKTLLDLIRRNQGAPARARLHKGDLLGGVAVALVIVLATLPIVVPFLLVSDPTIAARVSHGVALVLLFALGAWWGRAVGVNPLRTGAGLLLVGGVLVLITIALGG
jgi:hypothetical protein